MLNKKVIMAIAYFTIIGSLTACSSTPTTTASQRKQEQPSSPPAEAPASSTTSSDKTKDASQAKYTLDAQLVQDGNKAVITWKTNLTISAEHYGKEEVPGEGHAHVYVDGERVSALKTTDPYTVENLKPGKHKIKIDLQQNDHKPYGVEKKFDVEVK
jgi:hypothetical protein